MNKLNITKFEIRNQVVGGRGVSSCALIIDGQELVYEITSNVSLASYRHLYDAEKNCEDFEFFDNDGVLSVHPKADLTPTPPPATI